MPAAASLQALYTFEGTLDNAAQAAYAGTATVLTTDLSHAYVEENSAYSS